MVRVEPTTVCISLTHRYKLKIWDDTKVTACDNVGIVPKPLNFMDYDYVKRCGSRSISEQFYSYFQWFVSPENSQAKRTTGYFTNFFVAFFFSLFFRHYWYCDEQNRFNLRPPRGSRWTTNTESCLNTAKQHE